MELEIPPSAENMFDTLRGRESDAYRYIHGLHPRLFRSLTPYQGSVINICTQTDDHEVVELLNSPR